MNNTQQIIIKDNKINFKCLENRCLKSCCGPFCGLSNELASLDDRPFSEIILTDKDVDILFKHGHARLIEEAVAPNGKHYFRMKLMPDGTCTALKSGKCSIHAINPTLCKAFPFYIDMFAGLCAITCPGFDEDWTTMDALKTYFDATKEMYDYWMNFYDMKPKE